jgi:hypothetical protein
LVASTSRQAAREAKLHLICGDESLSDKVQTDRSHFDWVAARSACSLPKIFKTLRMEVEADVNARNALRPEDAPYKFSIVDKDNTFSVVLEAEDLHRSVTFCHEEHAIVVLDPSGNQMFEVILVFNDEGKCKMRAKEENRELWQIQRMALEDLLFRMY